VTGADLAAEYLDALGRTKPRDLLHLQRAGVGPMGLAIAPAVATISLSRGGLYYQPDPDSDAAAYILPVRGNPTSPEAADPVAAVRGAGIIDLLAFSAAYPGRWALRTGAAAWIGAVEPQYLMPDPTPVWRSPLHWLGQDCRGICLLTRDKVERYRVLTCLESIVAEDEAHAAELRDLLAHPWLAPPVYVRRGREVRNAA
jgi:hypothetical protein